MHPAGSEEDLSSVYNPLFYSVSSFAQEVRMLCREEKKAKTNKQKAVNELKSGLKIFDDM